MQSTGHASMHERSITSMHGSAITYGIGRDLLFLGEVDVLVLKGLVVDAPRRWCDPAGDLSGLVDRAHERPNVGLVRLAREPLVAVGLPDVPADQVALGGDVVAGEEADVPVE